MATKYGANNGLNKNFSNNSSFLNINEESILYEITNLKIYSIDQSDRYSKRYDLLANNGELKVYLNIDNDLNLVLSEANVLNRQFVNTLFKTIKFNDLKIRNNKLVVKCKSSSDNYFYGIESNLDHLMEIRDCLLNFREIYYPELLLINENNDKKKPVAEVDISMDTSPVKTNGTATLSKSEPVYNGKSDLKSKEENKLPATATNESVKKRKIADDEDEIKRVCRDLCQAIKTGDGNDASALAKKLAEYKLDLDIVLNKIGNDINNNSKVDDSNADVIVIKDDKTIELTNGSFDVNCLLMKDTSTNHKNIFLENLNINMKIEEIKLKVHNEFKIPLDNQFWIINDNAAEDGFMLKFYLRENIDNNTLTNAKFQLFVSSESKANAAANDGDTKMEIDEKKTNEEEYDGWKCNQCTLINQPLKLECEICCEKRPDEYVVPHKYAVNNEVNKLKHQKLSDYLAFDMQDLIENTESFECDICMEDNVGPREGAVLKECLHVFCKGCLREHILHCDDAVVKCPFSKDYVCEAALQEREIRALVSEDEYKKVQLKSLKQGEARIENTFHCKTPDCIGFCVYDEELHWFACPVCEQTNCLRCNVVHMGKTCNEYKEDLKLKAANDKVLEEDKKALEKMVKKGEAMHCPGCKIIVLKDLGCDWCQCLVCKMEICWATRGPRWGPKGHGDTSGGCKCNTNGRLCHPKCGNCH